MITDKPSPITVGLAQKSDADNLSTLFDHNVTRGALKNLITDKPSPITVGLAQVSSPHSDDPREQMSDVPKDGMRGNEEVYGPAVVGGTNVRYTQHVAQKDRQHLDDPREQMDHVPKDGMFGNEDLGAKNHIVGGNKVSYAQKNRITGRVDEDEAPVADLTVDGVRINFSQE